MPRLRMAQSRLRRMAPRLRLPAKTADPFYLSIEWRRLKDRRRLDPDWFAAKQRAKSGERLILDHVVERKDGGAELEPGNTEWLTFSEHQAKTAKARARRSERGGG